MSSLYLKYFQGQFVEVIAQVTMTEESDVEGQESKVPLLLHAFVVDRDNENTYFGHSPLEVSCSLSNADIKFTTITDPEVYEDSMFSGPESDESLN